MITVTQAKQVIDNALINFSADSTVGMDSINTINHAVQNEIQLRDYLIGLPLEHGVPLSAKFLSYLTTELPAEDSYALDTVNAMFQYEMGNAELCNELLNKVAISQPDYSLARLVRRVLGAGWPVETFATMRNELAPKVIAHLVELGDNEIA